MTITADRDASPTAVAPTHTWQIGDRPIPVKGPTVRDPRLHLAVIILTLIVIGMVWLDFRLSIPQFALAFLACGLIELGYVYRQTGTLVWPASGFQTATSTALILRVTGMHAHDWWSFDGWYYFVGIAAGGLLTKYFIRYRGRHIFNPSNVALVVAFIVLGAERIEPLDYWWGPFGWAIALAYTVIIVGGITLCRRVRMLEMAVAFYVTFVIAVGVLAALGQSITVRWSLTPLSGLHFWWILVTSPETLIFLYFMITDPKTTPTGRVGRIVFGCAVGVTSTILLAPWETEFGTKVGLLSGLVVMTAVRPFVERWWSVRAARPESVERDRIDWVAVSTRRQPRWAGGVAAFTGAAVLIPVIALAGLPNRNAVTPEPAPPAVAIEAAQAALPAVTVDDDVAGLSAELATSEGAQAVAEALAFNLQVEAEAILNGDVSLLQAVDHGQRLEDTRATIQNAAGGERVVPAYQFDTLHLSIVYPGGFQSGANAGLEATGTVTLTTYSASGELVGTAEAPLETLFALRKFPSGRWLTTAADPSSTTAGTGG